MNMFHLILSIGEITYVQNHQNMLCQKNPHLI